MPLQAFNGALEIKRAAHLLRRAAFGATKQQIDQFAALTPQQAIAILFPSTALPEPIVPVNPETGSEWVYSGVRNENNRDTGLETCFLAWFLGQMLSPGINDSNTSLAYAAREKVVMFLHTHFTTIKNRVGLSRSLYFQNQLFRLFALDKNAAPEVNFKSLTVKVSVDNAMLRLLDGALNVKGSVNENYARELLELYTIGRGIEGSITPSNEQGDYVVYTEDDIKEAAKVLSGWDVKINLETPFDPENPATSVFGFDPETKLPRGTVKGSTTNASSHDNTTKTFSARFNNAQVIPDPLLMNGTNATEESALDEIRQLVDMIYDKHETARNICWKVYRFFVYGPHNRYEAGTDTQRINDNIITPLVSTFINSGFKLQPVIEELLMSQHFYEDGSDVADDNFGGIIKSPVDLVIGSLRFFDYKLPSMESQTAEFYAITSDILSNVIDQGMNFYEPYDVAGYDAYHQFPVFHRYWITPNTLATRYQFINKLVSPAETSMIKINVLEFMNSHFAGSVGNVNTMIATLAAYLFPVSQNLDFAEPVDGDLTPSDLTDRRLNYFKEKFLQGFDDSYWHISKGEAKDWLIILFNTMLQTPEYQLA